MLGAWLVTVGVAAATPEEDAERHAAAEAWVAAAGVHESPLRELLPLASRPCLVDAVAAAEDPAWLRAEVAAGMGSLDAAEADRIRPLVIGCVPISTMVASIPGHLVPLSEASRSCVDHHAERALGGRSLTEVLAADSHRAREDFLAIVWACLERDELARIFPERASNDEVKAIAAFLDAAGSPIHAALGDKVPSTFPRCIVDHAAETLDAGMARSLRADHQLTPQESAHVLAWVRRAMVDCGLVSAAVAPQFGDAGGELSARERGCIDDAASRSPLIRMSFQERPGLLEPLDDAEATAELGKLLASCIVPPKRRAR